MLSKEEHDLVKQAVELIKRELGEMAPATPEAKPVKLALYKFGSFTIKKAKARLVVNPAVGGTVTIPERLVVRFSASKTWLEGLNQ